MGLCAVVMAGGSGARLWPLSRASYPKQFLTLNSEKTMLQDTFSRLAGLDITDTVTICNEEHRFLVAEQLREINQSGSIILEPKGRNTAPAIALAALSISDDPILLVLSADHVIKDEDIFAESVRKAIPIAETGKLVTFGIVPDEANTGYGYIKKGGKEGEGFKVEQFVEKPCLETANGYLSSGDYLWNSGMFLFRASQYLKELEKFREDIFTGCVSAVENATVDSSFCRVHRQSFEACPSESIDYAVMEKTADAVVVPMNAGWSDVGSWASLWDVTKKDKHGNASLGDVILHDTESSYIRTDGALVAVIGVKNMIITVTKDSVMVADKNSVQDVKEIVKKLEDQGRMEWCSPREVCRPWGKYDSVDNGDRHQVKRITVKPKAKLSVQFHRYRSEHWVVVSGTAKVTNGNETFILRENESTYIPVGAVHALENCGEKELELIEVQVGTYLGEDDIVRLEDRYGRVK